MRKFFSKLVKLFQSERRKVIQMLELNGTTAIVCKDGTMWFFVPDPARTMKDVGKQLGHWEQLIAPAR
jgi:hypothetical protein